MEVTPRLVWVFGAVCWVLAAGLFITIETGPDYALRLFSRTLFFWIIPYFGLRQALKAKRLTLN